MEPETGGLELGGMEMECTRLMEDIGNRMRALLS